MWTTAARSFCSQFGVSLPIIQAPMAGGPTTPELVSAVSKAGGLGSIGAGYLSPESLQEAIRATRQHTDSPFSINLFAEPDGSGLAEPSAEVKEHLSEFAKKLGVTDLSFQPEVRSVLDEHVSVCCDERVPVVSVTFGLLSPDQCQRLKSAGAKLIATATTTGEACIVEQNGYDAVVLQGFEAGAHRGSFTPEAGQGVGLLPLMSQASRVLRIPFIASGGIMDGQAIAACLLMGASAVQMGTAFLTTDESGADLAWKDRIVSASDSDTVLTRAFSGKLARGLRNEFINTLEPIENGAARYPVQNQITNPIRAAAKKARNTEFMSLWCGQAARLSRRTSAADLLRQLADEVSAAITGFR
jgi:nitronate monooxygenase